MTKLMTTPSYNLGLNLGKIWGISGFGRAGRKFIQDGALDRAGLETFPALLTKVQHDGRFSFVKADDPRRAGTSTGTAAVAPVGIDPGV
jgi:hypothetical protein